MAAIQWKGDNWYEVVRFVKDQGGAEEVVELIAAPNAIRVDGEKGRQYAHTGDWIVKGERGFYVSPDEPLDVKKLLAPIQRATIEGFVHDRHAKQKAIEDAIMILRPDALEAHDLIDAIAAGLKRRYENPSEVLLRMTLLQGDLERLDQRLDVDADDVLSAYERATERRRAGGAL